MVQDSAHDVAIMGGGLAGLTLAIQLKRQCPDAGVLVLEKRSGPAPEIGFKVGESTVNIGAHYFSAVVGMEEHLKTEQLRKLGLRYFFPAGDNSDLASRIEFGPKAFPPVNAYQIDRGRFENALATRARELDIELRDGCRVTEVDLHDGGHTVTLEQDGKLESSTARWVVDATGRASLLKRKLSLEKPVGHVINSAWFRLAGGMDLENWVDDPYWFQPMSERGIRQFSTNHLMGEGYWVWLIPLSTNAISIGIVADPRFHPFDEMNTLDGALNWIAVHEPALAHALEGRRDDVVDFLKVENFAYSVERAFSPERWCLTGEAAAFADPFYSPGSDMIAIGNTLIADAIARDLAGEAVADRIESHNEFYLRLFEQQILPRYEDAYAMFGNAQVMSLKLTWNNLISWGVLAFMFVHGRIADLDFRERVEPDLERAFRLNLRMEQLFRDWHKVDAREWQNAFIDITSVPALIRAGAAIGRPMDEETENKQVGAIADEQEAMAVIIFSRALQSLGETIEPSRRINPYGISMHPERWEAEGAFDGSGLSLDEALQRMPGMETRWMERIADPVTTSA